MKNMVATKSLFLPIMFLISLILGVVNLGGCANENPVDSKDTTLAPGASEGNGDEQDPAYISSIRVPDDENDNEADESAKFSELATITYAQAAQSAQTKVSGTVIKNELENENGNVVYSVEIDTGSGTKDVKVDAGNGNILHVESDEAEGVEENGKDKEDDPDGLESNHEFDGEEEGEN